MDLLNLLDNEVCKNNLLSFLPLNDLLRLGRVCKSTRNQTQDFIRIRKIETGRELKIDFNADKNPFKEYEEFQGNVASCLHARNHVHFHLLKYKSRGESRLLSFNQPLQNFLQLHGNMITHLTISQLVFPYDSRLMLTFLESCPNVTHLVLHTLCISSMIMEESRNGRMMLPAARDVLPNDFRFPSTIKNIKGLVISGGIIWNQIGGTFLLKLVESCIPNLERVSLPLFDLDWDFCDPLEGEIATRLVCLALFGGPKLKLDDVYGHFIKRLICQDDRTREMRSVEMMVNILKAKVISIHTPRETSFIHEFPNLETISFEWGECETPVDLSLVKREWPKLKSTIIKLDDSDGLEARLVWDVMFVGIVRENLVKLDIGCAGMVKMSGESFQRTRDLVTSCPNITTLKIQRNIKNVLSLPVLWRGLAHLKMLTIYLCVGLGDEDFIGDDAESPAFSNLKNLTSLTLDCSPTWAVIPHNLTNDLFSRVLCHMELKELELLGDFPKVTREGIMSLLDGKFAESIQRLSITEAKEIQSAEDVQELKRIESLFRSSQMC